VSGADVTLEEEVMNSILDWRAAFVVGLTLCGVWTSDASAQGAGGSQQGTAQPQQGTLPGPLEDAPVKTQDYAAPGAQPTPPNKTSPEELESQEDLQVAMDTGVGSGVAYASESVVELGGMFALTHASDTTVFRIAPLVGYFFVDNLELTLFPELAVINVDGNTDVMVGVVLEPSYHLPLSDTFFVFAGIGVGVGWAEDPGFDFVLRPKLGVDIMVGRSGILKPAGFISIGTNDGLSSGGVEASFTVML
jgi:hypothetical protein